MNIDEVINGWTFEETIKTAESLMEVENNMFKWDVIRHLRDFAEAYKEQLKEYQQLEEQGRLIKLPYKIGDTVYEITGATTRGYDWKYLTYEKAYVHGTVFNLDRLYDIGKTVFLTKSEAEAKLKELRGKNE